MWRFLDVSGEGYYFHVRDNNLEITRNRERVQRIDFEDVNSIVLSGHNLLYTDRFLQKCMECDIPLIICDSTYLPIGILQPYMQKGESAARIHWQFKASLPLKKQLWTRMVKEKLQNQGKLLALQHHARPAGRLAALSRKVKSGDADNAEGSGAAIYFSCIFGQDFRRRTKNSDQINSVMNFGYTVLRGSMARGIAGSGLNPGISLFHSYKINPFALADDLLEPLRPLVDRKICWNWDVIMREKTLTPKIKRIFTDILSEKLVFGDGKYNYPAGIAKYVNSYVQSLEKKKPELEFPTYL